MDAKGSLDGLTVIVRIRPFFVITEISLLRDSSTMCCRKVDLRSYVPVSVGNEIRVSWGGGLKGYLGTLVKFEPFCVPQCLRL